MLYKSVFLYSAMMISSGVITIHIIVAHHRDQLMAGQIPMGQSAF